MGIRKAALLIERKAAMKSISKVIVVLLSIFIVGKTFTLVVLGMNYLQALNAGGTVPILGVVELAYSSTSELIQVICVCLMYLADGVLAIVWLVLLWGFFNQIAAENKAFLPGQGKRLQTIALLMILSPLLSSVYTAWAMTLSAEAIHISAIIWGSAGVLGIGLFYPLMFFCMALIFNAGLRLQTESDETL